MFPNDAPMYRVIERISFGDLAGADVRKALAMVELAMTPMPPAGIAAALTKLRALTKARAESAVDMEITVAAYADELARFPADVVRETLAEWPRRKDGKWWPSWHELERILSSKSEYRRILRSRLEREVVGASVREAQQAADVA